MAPSEVETLTELERQIWAAAYGATFQSELDVARAGNDQAEAGEFAWKVADAAVAAFREQQKDRADGK